MGLFKRAHVRGINHELVRQGLIGWPSEKIAEEATDVVADELPDEMMPEVSGDEGLSAEEAAAVIDQLVEVADAIAEKTGQVKDENLSKLAVSVDYETAAKAHATALLSKAAAEAGTDVTGDGRFQETMMDGGMGHIDAQKDPSSEKVGPQGTSTLDTSPGEVGAQAPQLESIGPAENVTSEVSKLSSQVSRLSELLNKQSSTDPGSGNTGTPAREEPKDNQEMSGVAPAQGKTTQPKGPLMGSQQPQARAQSPATPGEVAKLSSLLEKAIQKVSGEVPPELKENAEDMKQQEAKEEKKKKDKDEEPKKEEEKSEEEKKAALANALQTLAVYANS